MNEKKFPCGCEGICHYPYATNPAWQLFTLCSKHRNVNYYYPTRKHMYECGCFKSKENDEYASSQVFPCDQHKPLYDTYYDIKHEKTKKVKAYLAAIDSAYKDRIEKAHSECFLFDKEDNF